MIENSFVSRRLEQMPNMGATLAVAKYRNGVMVGRFLVSNVKLAGEVYTRVQLDGTPLVMHMVGDIDTHDAADLAFLEFFPQHSMFS